MAQANATKELYKSRRLLCLREFFWITCALGCPFVKNELVLGQCARFITEKVVDLSKVFMQTIILNLTVFELILCAYSFNF